MAPLVDAQAFAEHAASVAHRNAVNTVTNGLRVNNVAIRSFGRQVNVGQHPTNIALADLVMTDGHFKALVM